MPRQDDTQGGIEPTEPDAPTFMAAVIFLGVKDHARPHRDVFPWTNSVVSVAATCRDTKQSDSAFAIRIVQLI